MKNKNIFLDFDGLKFNTTPLIVNFMNEKYGINSKIDDYLNKGSYIHEILHNYRPDLKHITKDDVYLAYGNEFANSIEKHSDIVPISGMIEIVNRLSKKYNLYTVTARQESGKHVIKHVVDRFIPNCIVDIHCVWKKSGSSFCKIPKIDFVKSIKGEHVAFFDDSLHEIHEMQDFIPSYLFNPKNSNNDLTGIKNHVSSWEEFGEKFL